MTKKKKQKKNKKIRERGFSLGCYPRAFSNIVPRVV